MQYQAWLDMIDRLEQIITKIESGTEVTDPGAVSELEQIRSILSSPLTVQDSAAQTELSLIKEKLEDIETKLNGTLTTQLTGSIVHEPLDTNFTLAAGSSQLYNLDLTGYGAYRLVLRRYDN